MYSLRSDALAVLLASGLLTGLLTALTLLTGARFASSRFSRAISAIEKRMNFLQVVNDRVITVPYETGLISGPGGVSVRSHAVVGVIESRAVFPVRSKNHRNATAGPALWTKAKL